MSEAVWSPGSRQEKAQFAREAAVNRGDVSQETWNTWQNLNDDQAVDLGNLDQSGIDYYNQLVENGATPVAEAIRQQQSYQAPNYIQTASSAMAGVQPQQEEQQNRKSVVVNEDAILSPRDRLQQQSESEKDYYEKLNKQSKLNPQVITDDIDKIQEQYEEWQKQREERPGFTGIDSIDKELERRFTDMSTGEIRNPLDWNILGFTSQQETPTQVKNIYDYYFAQEDANPMSDEEREKRRGTWGQGNDSIPDYIKNLPVHTVGKYGNTEVMNLGDSNELQDWWSKPVVNENMIDDGLSPESRESIWMTGDRYYDYVTKYGLPGRDPSEINRSPNAIYSKQDEMEKYGFIPYLTNEGYYKFHDDAAANAVNNTVKNLADFRRNNWGYSYNYDGNKYDGKDFDRQYNIWLNNHNNEDRQPIRDESKVKENAVPLAMYMTDTEGKIHYPLNKGVFKYDEETGKPMVDFQTGNPNDNWYFDDENDFKKSLHYEEINENNPVVAAWDNAEPLVLEDGQVIRADKAQDLYRNREQYADYGPAHWGKPSIEDPLADIGSGEILPWFVDMALGSAPLFWGPSAATQALGGAYAGWNGFKPGVQTANGEYKLLSEDPTNEERLMSATGSSILPLTERLWGVAGSGAKYPFEKVVTRRNPQAVNHPLYSIPSNAWGEAVEEIPGNLVEEMTGAGTAADYFANPYYYQVDENGNVLRDENDEPLYTLEDTGHPIYDNQGNQIRDPNTSWWDRLVNFLKEAPMSMLGGGLLGGVLGLPHAAVEGYKYKQDKAEAEKERDEYGYNLFVPDEVENYGKRQAGE